ncbi:hypothetical protein T484DRAFT_1775590 [Baffinella frigidus]|nr:hypothetical protein T484DRAFT_1775590 [Cryptophyta sp. CCMP2293]
MITFPPAERSDLCKDGGVVAFGANARQQLGLNDDVDRNLPNLQLGLNDVVDRNLQNLEQLGLNDDQRKDLERPLSRLKSVKYVKACADHTK